MEVLGLKARGGMWVCIVSIAIALLLTSSAETAPRVERGWHYVDVELASSVIKDTNVYAEASLKSNVVGKLKKSAKGTTNDVWVEFAKILVNDTYLPEGDVIYEGWWYINKPARGWVEGPKLSLWETGYLLKRWKE